MWRRERESLLLHLLAVISSIYSSADGRITRRRIPLFTVDCIYFSAVCPTEKQKRVGYSSCPTTFLAPVFLFSDKHGRVCVCVSISFSQRRRRRRRRRRETCPKTLFFVFFLSYLLFSFFLFLPCLKLRLSIERYVRITTFHVCPMAERERERK